MGIVPTSHGWPKVEKMKKLKHIGAGYHGFDAVENKFVFVKNGDEVEVSDDKAAQLFADFGKEWVEVETPRVVEVEPVKVKGKK